MWKDYSVGFIRNNRASSISIMVAAFISSLFLSFLCSMFYNVWVYEVEKIVLEEGDWQGRLTGVTAVSYTHLKDIVCASASALVLNMANSVEQFTDDGFDGNVEEETGHFTFRFTGDISKESKLLMDSLILGLKNIEEAYGEEYIKIRFKEV